MNSCHANSCISMNQDASSTIVQGASTLYHPISTRTLHKNVLVVTPWTEKASAQGEKSNSSKDDSQVSVNSGQKYDDSLVSVNAGQEKLGKNAWKKPQQRAALIENQSRSNQSSTTDSEVLEKSPWNQCILPGSFLMVRIMMQQNYEIVPSEHGSEFKWLVVGC
jgi:hypothetical protein